MKYIFILLSVLILSSCKYNSTFSELKSLKESKAKVEAIAADNLTAKNQLILRTYFSSLKNLAYDFLSNSRMQQYTHKKFFNYFDDSLCEETLLDEKFYSQILKKCTANGFYVCSDEVRAYKKILSSVKNLFNENELKKMTSSDSCKTKLLSLGVLSE